MQQKLVNEVSYLVGVVLLAGIALMAIFGVQPPFAIGIGLVLGLVLSVLFGQHDLMSLVVYAVFVVVGVVWFAPALGQPLVLGVMAGYLVGLVVDTGIQALVEAAA